jgi:NAD-dependent dihydropyrimidine dehydrogenase PreA subunit
VRYSTGSPASCRLQHRLERSDVWSTVSSAHSFALGLAGGYLEDRQLHAGAAGSARLRCRALHIVRGVPTACPTGALTISHGSEVSILIHDPSVCLGCPLCLRACPEDALKVRRALDVGRLRGGQIELMHAESERCAECRVELMPLPMRRRVAEALGRSAVPLDLCARCATEYERLRPTTP